MERWLSWSKAHDWKSCVPYKGTEGSNPSLSAKKESSLLWRLFFIWNGKGFDWYFLRKYQSSFALWFVGSFGFSTRQSLVLTHSLGWLSRYSVRIRRNRHAAPIIFFLWIVTGVLPSAHLVLLIPPLLNKRRANLKIWPTKTFYFSIHIKSKGSLFPSCLFLHDLRI